MDQEEECEVEGPCAEPAQSSAISDMDRRRIVKAYLAGKKPKIISEIMDLPQRKVLFIIRNYSKTGRLGPASASRSTATSAGTSAHHKETKLKLEDSQVDMLRHWASEDATLTNAALAQRFNETFNMNLAVTAVPKLLDPCIFSISRLTRPAEVLNDQRTIALRKDYCQIFSELPSMYEESEITYIGQVRFRLAIRNKESRGKVRLRNMSICVGFSKYDVIGYLGQNAPITPEQYQDFISTVIDYQQQRSQPTGVVILEESALSGDSDSLSDLIQSKEYTNIFLPPNSPFLNPCEVFFNEIRDLLAHSATAHDQLNEAFLVATVTDGTRIIQNMECSRYVDSVMAFVPRCLESEPIEMATDVHSILAEACENADDDRAASTEEIQILYTAEEGC